MKPLLSLVTTVIASWQYAHLTYDSLDRAATILYSWDQRPYVYRMLTPLVSRLLHYTGLSVTTALELSVVIFAVTLLYSMYILLRSTELATISVVVFTILFYEDHTVYDFATAAMFALMFVFLIRMDTTWYFVAFCVSCLAKETTILMVLVFAIYMYPYMRRFRWITRIALQLITFCAIRFLIQTMYSDNPGSDFIFRPQENIQRFAEHPWLTLIHWLLIGLVIFLCLRQWRKKPWLYVLSFVVLAPIFLIMYILIGSSYEVRIFVELYPIVVPLIVEIPYGRTQNAKST
jgi:hypothetical protein